MISHAKIWTSLFKAQNGGYVINDLKHNQRTTHDLNGLADINGKEHSLPSSWRQYGDPYSTGLKSWESVVRALL